MVSEYSFTRGHPTTFSLPENVIIPYISDFKFNKIVDRKKDDPKKTVYSIDPNAMLEILKKDDLADLFKITLACRPTRSGVGLWDTLFNYVPRQGISACIFACQQDYTPIPSSRIDYASQFLNFSMSVSRVHLNRILKQDKVGIAISDFNTNQTYVLIYTVEDFCYLPSPKTSEDETTYIIPVVNIKMRHALLINEKGEGKRIDMEQNIDYDEEKAGPFVQCLFHSVLDITEAYPWKPHFTPIIPRYLDREQIETRLLNDVEIAQQISFQELEDWCRYYYKRAKEKAHQLNKSSKLDKQKKSKTSRSEGQREFVTPPVIEVFSKDDQFILKFDRDSDPSNKSYFIHKEDFGKYLHTETFLLNKDLDLEKGDISGKALILNREKFGENAYVRYFYVNF